MAFDFLGGKKHLSCFLVTIQTPEGVFYRVVDDKSFSVGRSLDCALSFPDPNISRVHIVVTSKKDQVWLIDQGSANGTFVNSERISASKMTLVQATDDIKLGTSEIHLKIDVFEKVFKEEDLSSSLLPEQEKSNLMEIIQGAHQQAKRIILQAQEHYDKLIKSAEQKVRNVENSLLIKQDEIISAANVQANQLVQDGKKKSAQIIFDAEQKALDAAKSIFDGAEQTKAKADDYYQEKVNEAQKKSDEIIKNHTAMGSQLIQEARDKSQEVRKKLIDEGELIKQKLIKEADQLKKEAHSEGERLKDEYIEKAKIELQTTLAHIFKDIDQAQFDLNNLENQKEKMKLDIDVEKEQALLVLKSQISEQRSRAESELNEFLKEIEKEKNQAQSSLQSILDDIQDKKQQAESDLLQSRQILEKQISDLQIKFENDSSVLNEKFSSKEKLLQEKFEKEHSELIKNLEIEAQMLREKQAHDLAEENVKTKKNLDSELVDLRHELEKIKKERDHEIKRKQDEIKIILEKQEIEIKRIHRDEEVAFKKKVEDLEFHHSKLEKEIQRLVEFRDAEIKQREEELAQIFQKHLFEIEKINAAKEQEMREKVENDLLSKKRDISEIEGQISALKIEIEKISKAKLAHETEYEKESNKLSQLREEIQKTFSDKKSVEDSYQGLLRQIQKFDEEKKEAVEKVKELESRAGHLQLAVEHENKKLSSMAKDYDLKLKEYKQKLDVEFEQLRKEKEAQFRESFNVEAENAKQLKAHMLLEVQSKQDVIMRDIHQKVLKLFSVQVPKENLTSLSESAMKQIKLAFDENVASISAQNQASKLNTTEVQKKQQKLRFQSMSMGLVLGLALMGGYKMWSDHLRARTLASVIKEQEQARAEDLAQRKFKPDQDFEVKETYTDSVIYTKDFSVLYKDAQVQDKWLREASDYMFKTWRIPEEKTIELLSKVKTLVGTLDEKKENIHPDFVEQNIQKMKELEGTTVSDLKALLGTDVKFEAFKKYEKKFFMNELSRRAPAEVYVDPSLEETK